MKSNPKDQPTKKRKRCTPHELDQRLDLVETLLFQKCLMKSQVRKFVIGKYDVDWRTVDEYCSRARARVLLRISESRNEMRSKSLALYQGILRTGTGREKILAQERIDRLMGLEAPKMISHGGSDVLPPIKTDATVTDKSERPLRGMSKEDLLAVIALSKKGK